MRSCRDFDNTVVFEETDIDPFSWFGSHPGFRCFVNPVQKTTPSCMPSLSLRSEVFAFLFLSFSFLLCSSFSPFTSQNRFPPLSLTTAHPFRNVFGARVGSRESGVQKHHCLPPPSISRAITIGIVSQQNGFCCVEDGTLWRGCRYPNKQICFLLEGLGQIKITNLFFFF